MSNKDIVVPDIGDFADVEVIEVLVSAGDEISAEDPIITLESDKATMDVPSPANGKLLTLTVNTGDRVSEGSVIATMEVNEEPSPQDSKPEPQTTAAPPPAAAPEESPAPAQATIDPVQQDDDEDSTPVKPVRRAPPASLPPPVERSGDALPHASPGIRRFARELGADLTQVRGSGPKGRILKEDVKAFIKQRLTTTPALAAATPVAASGAGIPPIPEVDFSRFGEIEEADVPRIKKISGAHLHRAWLNVPHVTQFDEADITGLEAFRKSTNAELAKSGRDTKVTLLAFVMKAMAKALHEFPLFNASLTGNGEKLVYKKYFHIGIAVDTPNGLVVPVFRNVDQKGVLELADEMAETSSRARTGKLKPDDMQGGSMSISSLGGIGGTAFTPIVNAPEVAILGLSRSRMQPVWNGEEFKPKLILPMSLSYDHRVIDGAEAARFSTWLAKALSDPRRLLL